VLKIRQPLILRRHPAGPNSLHIKRGIKIADKHNVSNPDPGILDLRLSKEPVDSINKKKNKQKFFVYNRLK
jgi:hypothetical protein